MSLCCCCSKVIAGGALLKPAAAASALAPPALPSSSVLSLTTLASRRSIIASSRTYAKRKSSSSVPLQHDDDGEVLDEDFKNSINELSTDAIRAMLSEDMKRMEGVQEKLFELEMYFEKENENDALLFVNVIKDMLDHKIAPEVKQLKGIYKKAFQKIFNIVEDSGWSLKGDDDESEAGMIDDELIPPTLMSEYR